jgi:hypothetical protein
MVHGGRYRTDFRCMNRALYQIDGMSLCGIHLKRIVKLKADDAAAAKQLEAAGIERLPEDAP